MAQLICFLIFGGLGLMLLVVGAQQWWQQRRNLARARPVKAVIVRSEVVSSTSSDTNPELLQSTATTSHRAEVAFRFELDGRAHQGERLHPHVIAQGHASVEAAEAELAPFPLHAEVQAWVDPAYPERAFLVAEPNQAPLVFMVLGLVLPPLAWVVGGVL